MKYQFTLLLVAILCFSSCKEDPSFIFEVDNVAVKPSSADKNRLKTDIEFVSIAYTDIYGSSISQSELEDIITSYQSFGDKSLVIELIIRKFIFTSQSNIPSINRNNISDVENFVQQAYEKLYNRTPNAFEKWYLSDYIMSNSFIDGETFYYSLMTSNEYRYY